MKNTFRVFKLGMCFCVLRALYRHFYEILSKFVSYQNHGKLKSVTRLGI